MDMFVNFWFVVLCDMIINIVEVGFFYMGCGDEIVCFFCDCCVCDWYINEDIW